MDMYFEQLKMMVFQFAPNLVMALITLVVGFWIANKVSQVLSVALRRRHVEETIIPFLGSLVSVVLKVLVLISVAGKFGVETTSFIALVGGAGLAVGLALQGSLAHFASGVLLLVFRPYKVGDLISAAGFTGEVEAIQIFNTVLKTLDNKRIFIPNGAITAGPITNISGQGTIRVDLVFAISGDEDVDKARASVQKAADASPLILKNPAVDILVHGHEVGITKLDVRPWCNSADYWDVYYYMQEKVKTQFEADGIRGPKPAMDVVIVK